MASTKKPLIVAHRGASWDFPENTLASIRAAWAQGADLVEIDVRLSRDGAVVLLHDDTFQRTAGCALAPEAMDLADIRKLDAGAWKASQFAGERVPTLPEALAAVPRDKGILIEIKAGDTIVPALRRDLQPGLATAGRVYLICFHYETLRQAKAALPEIKALYLAGGAWENKVRTEAELDGLVTQAVAAGFDGLDLGDDWPLDAAQVRRVQAAGLECHVWTVNDATRARQLVAAGIDSITTDRPGWLRAQL
ncbi:MAG: glycerophosphodiester phosphodiesterase [Opitutaceae bacterium]|nr:glycerophosphodiester phosphodiesterase [Opitutaceae bacterium]